jgi:hypothetical protein
MIPADLIECARAVRIEDELARRGITLRGRGSERCGPCPQCGGTDRFSVNIKDQVFNCRRCEGKGRGAVDLVMFLDGSAFKSAVATLAGEPRQAPAPAAAERVQQPKKTYFDYVDEAGVALSREVRLERPGAKKQTWQEAADPDRPGQWINGEGCMTGVRRVPFQLPGLLKVLKTGETIFIVEGPRKCGPLYEWGLCATCNMGGSSAASVWREHAKEFFLPVYSSPVVILPDNESAAIIADALASVGVAVQILDLPGLPVKGDLINWIDGGGTRQQFLDLVEAEARAWAPSEAASERIGVNSKAFAGNGKQHKGGTKPAGPGQDLHL